METKNIIDIKLNNVKNILDIIRLNNKYTKKDIAEHSGLSFSTVSNLCRELIDKGIIREVAIADTTINVGRSPKNISLNYSDFYGVCIDLHNGNNVVLAITNLRNESIISKRISINTEISLDEFLTQIYKMFQCACSESKILTKRIIGVCVAVPAIFDSQEEVLVNSGIDILEGQPLKEKLKKIFRLPIYIDNEANILSKAIAEQNTPSIQNIAYILCSDGLGAGIIVNGKQLVGEHGYAPEVFHIPIGNTKLHCRYCGQTGCVESDLSIRGFITKYFDFKEFDKSKINDYWNEYVEAVSTEDKKALSVLNENAKIMGQLISIVMNLFDPKVVCIGGDVAVLFERMKPIIKEEVLSRACYKKLGDSWLIKDDNNNTLISGCAEIIYNKTNFLNLKYE